MIREMIQSDWQRVAEIYEQGLEKGISTFQTECPTYEEWDAAHIRDCRYVYVTDKKVVGWIALTPSSSRCAYKGCVEVSIFSINEASIALHKKTGFREIGYREKIAKDRFGTWQNTTLMERRNCIM